MASKIKVLIVDDNKSYRDAFRRNLSMHNYEICEAENADEALQVLKEENPDVMVTDLRMRTRTEGLDLIKQARDLSPLLPVVMISAVGTFEEGAIATKLGAADVISKSHIEEEIAQLYHSIDTAHEEYQANKRLMNTINEARKAAGSPAAAAFSPKLKAILQQDDVDPYVKGEAYDALLAADAFVIREASHDQMSRMAAEGPDESALFKAIDEELRTLVPGIEGFEPDSREALRTAEYFYHKHHSGATEIDFSRNIGFSYCFAVENEAKARLRKKLNRFLGSKETYDAINCMLDPRTRHLNLFFHQYLLRLQQGREFDFTIDNVKQTFHRILEHESRYKPDGLKALGIIVICFGRDYAFQTPQGKVVVSNPLNLKGMKDDEEVLTFAQLLVSLQHSRNPYIHPEISEMQKVSKLRDTTMQCLHYICQLV
jgi:CheY-like chemotaxis protein